MTFDVVDTPAGVTVGETYAPTIGVYLAGIGALTLDGVHTAGRALVVTADFNLTVVPFAVVDTGAGTFFLAAGAEVFGVTTVPDGVLTIAAGVVLVSSNSSEDAISLYGSDIEIDTGVDPATIGLSHVVGQPPVPLAGGVVFDPAASGIPINVGAASGTGLHLSNAELARVFTTATGTITFGNPSFTSNITFAGASPATTAGASVAVLQSPNGSGAIVLDGSAGTALDVGTGNIQLSAGTGGIVATGVGSSLATSGQITLDTAGGIGIAANRIVFGATATPPAVTIGSESPPAAGAYLGGLGSLTLAGALTVNSPLDVTAAVRLDGAPERRAGNGDGHALTGRGTT